MRMTSLSPSSDQSSTPTPPSSFTPITVNLTSLVAISMGCSMRKMRSTSPWRKRPSRNTAKQPFFSFGGPVTLPLNRQTPDGPIVNFSPHNIREGLHGLYALVKYRDDDDARELSERCIAAIFELWSPENGWDPDRLRNLGLNYGATQGFIHGEASMLDPLVKLYRVTGYGPALELALAYMEKATSEFFLEDGEYDLDCFITAHSHSITCVLSSLAQLAELLEDASLLHRVKL